MRRIRSDVLVIGGGGAGMMAAHEAAKESVRVAVVNKGKLQRTGATIMAPGAIAAVDDRWKSDGDSKQLHMEDTIRGGSDINDRDMVKTVVEQSPEMILELERMGALFQREKDGKHYMLRIDGGHTYPRCMFLEDRVGKEMVKAMSGALRKQRVDVYEDIMITQILKEDGVVAGALGMSTVSFEPVLFECKAIILATGGAGTLYENTDNPIDITGDGFHLGLEAGARLRDMEFVQFFPIGFLEPPSLRGILGGLLYYCHLLNINGERFMEKYDPERLELSTRDRVSRAIIQEVREGRGTPNGGVYMDMRYQDPEFLIQMMPALSSTYRSMGKDPKKDLIEIAPTVHFFMGGLEVDQSWGTRVPGLYGAGETCGGMHGGNRLSQNALAELLVAGRISGKSAAAYAKKREAVHIDPAPAGGLSRKITEMLECKSGTSPGELRARLRKLMTEKVGVIRSEGSLKSALKEINDMTRKPVKIRSKDPYMNREILKAFENENLLITARAIILSAMQRQESRAAHFRSDYPERDDGNYLCNFYVSLKKDGLTVSRESVKGGSSKQERL